MQSIFASSKTVTVDEEEYLVTADETIEGTQYFEVEHLGSGETEKVRRNGTTAMYPVSFTESDLFDSMEVLQHVDGVEFLEN